MASACPPNEWITHAALMPRPPGESLLDRIYARSSKASLSTPIVRSIAGFIVRVTINSSAYRQLVPLRLTIDVRMAKNSFDAIILASAEAGPSLAGRVTCLLYTSDADD